MDSRQDMDGPAAREAAFALQRAQTSAYHASKYLAEHPGSPEAQRGLQDAQGRCQAALAAVQKAEMLAEEERHQRESH